MGKLTNSFFLELSLVLICLPPIYAQTATTAPANAKAAPTNKTPAGQAPDDVMTKLADLVRAGKYAEAQQLTGGLLLAYPDDQRLIKAKALLDRSLASSEPPDSASSSNQLVNSIGSATNTNAAQLTGMDKVEYNSLIELARQAQQTTDLEQQKTTLQKFMNESRPFVVKHPDEILIWQLRAASALSLNDLIAGYEAGQKLLAAGAGDSNDPHLQHLMAQLNLKGMLDKQKVEITQRFDWLLGKWNVSWAWYEKSQIGG